MMSHFLNNGTFSPRIVPRKYPESAVVSHPRLGVPETIIYAPLIHGPFRRPFIICGLERVPRWFTAGSPIRRFRRRSNGSVRVGKL